MPAADIRVEGMPVKETIRKIYLGRTFVIPLFLASVFMLAQIFLSVRQPVKAEALPDYMPYTLGTVQSGVVTKNGAQRQYYQFTLPSSGQIHITGSIYMEWVYLCLYDENAGELWADNPRWNSALKESSVNKSLYLASGTYYFGIRRDGNWTGSFQFQIDFLSSNESFRETNGGSNNTIAAASEINPDGTAYNGQIAENDRKDCYKFVLTESGKVCLNAVFYDMEHVCWKLHRESGEEILSKNLRWNAVTRSIAVDEDLYLNSGTYYISVSENYGCSGMYTFSLPFTPSGETYPEAGEGSDNVFSDASPMTLGTAYKGQTALNDDKDIYRFTLPSSLPLSFQLEADMQYIYIKLYDSSGKELFSENPYWDPETQKLDFFTTSVLDQGTYYIAAVQDGSNYGTYVLAVSELTQENCRHSYNSEWHEATYFDKGYRQYSCGLCGHSYKTDYTAVRKLPRGRLGSSCSAGRGVLDLSWVYVPDASGCQIRYSMDKSMKSGVVTKKVKDPGTARKMIKGLARRRNYYVQVRPYKTNGSNAKAVYGRWSSKRRLKTR